MRLNKKYCALIDSDSGYDNQLLADCCENIADEFAIGFADWVNSLYVATDYKTKSTKELLEIYKKEKLL
jgi:hypothetical protein